MMTSYNDLILDENYKLRINSKKLKSGKFQVKFFATIQDHKDLYGYLLVNSDETLKGVIEKIRTRLHDIDYSGGIYPYNLTGDFSHEPNFMIFQ